MEQTVDSDLEGLRMRHELRPLTAEEEGFATNHLPNGVYGFTCAPSEELVPLFAKKTWHSFEVHKLPDGSEHLIGFVTPQEADAIRKGLPGHVELFPDPWEQSSELVSIPRSRMAPSKRGPSREGGNGLKMELLG
jgi:hypothetical protein